MRDRGDGWFEKEEEEDGGGKQGAGLIAFYT
jgi:hypothetical protein